MSDNSDERRDRLHAFLQSEGVAEDATGAEGALLTGWAIVTEWMAPDGERWLSKAHAASSAEWHAQGMHHAALYDDWPTADDEESE